MNIPELTDKEFDDPVRLREELTRILKDLKKLAGKIPDIRLPDNAIIYMVDDGVTPISTGFKKADGTQGTFNVEEFPLIPIQKV